MYKVVEIFNSIEGEGKRSGRPATFIRLAGCNLRCSYCDTEYAQNECESNEMSLPEIIEKCDKKAVTITGGEPLIHQGIVELVNALLADNHEVNIETNGSVDIMDLLNEAQIHSEDKLFFTIDYKLSSSKMTDKMLWNNFENLMPEDVIKFVVGSDEDFSQMLDVVKKLKALYSPMPKIYIGCVFGKYDLKNLTEKIVGEPMLDDANLQLQIHKIIWSPNERGV